MADAGAEPLDPTLQDLLDHDSLKWIFVGGKGGVGKTTCSCSLAVQLAAKRANVLIISTDPAHNLSDAFKQKFTSTPTLVNGMTNLSAMEVDPQATQTDFSTVDDSNSSSFLGDLVSSFPGIDEAMSFAEVMRQVQTMDYDCIVFDTAPTGHTLRLLQLPTTIQKGLDKLMSLRGMMGGALDQITAMMGVGGDAQGSILAKLDELKAVVEEVNTQFRDPDLTTFVCVCIPEFLSLYETERLVQELARNDIDTCNIIINQIIFDDAVAGSKLMRARIRMQQRYLDQFDDLYEDFHLVKLPLLEEEVRGLNEIKEFSKNLMTAYKPPAVAAEQDRVQELEKEVVRLRAECEDLRRQLAQHS